MNYDSTRVYLGGPLFLPTQQAVLAEVDQAIFDGFTDAEEFLQRNMKLEVFRPREESAPIWNGRPPKDCSGEERYQVFQGNFKHVQWADVLIAWVGGMDQMKPMKDDKPSPPDSGVVWEMGLAFGVGTPVIAYIDPSDTRQEMNLMLSNSVNAVAHGVHELREIMKIFTLDRGFPLQYAPEGRLLEEAGA